MPTKKNRGTEGRNHAIFSVGESLGQPSHGIGSTPAVEFLFDAIQGGIARQGRRQVIGRAPGPRHR